MRPRINQGNAAEKYAAFKGKQVIIYYRDMHDTDRKLYGVMTDVVGDTIYLENGVWNGALDCSNARVSLVSTVEGWNKAVESKEEVGLFGKIFRR